jgi:ADP-ribose pyrophosphatase YjhB (NUDIX family)
MNIVSDPSRLLNVFEPGLLRGSARLPFAPHKEYFFVQHPVQEWRVYMRAACFIHVRNPDGSYDPEKFIVVKKTGSKAHHNAWEPPKGQMEGKDAKPEGEELLALMTQNIRREIQEESKIENLEKIVYTGLVIQSQEKDYPSNHYFQYHIFQAVVSEEEVNKAFGKFVWYKEHPAAFSQLRADKREKDDIAFFSPSKTRLMGRWSPSIVALYLHHTKKGSIQLVP